jgi:ribosome recycling factor
MIDDLINDATRRMDKSVESTHNEFNTIRTGRASAALLDRVTVDYYGQQTPLKQLATINVPEPRLLTVQEGRVAVRNVRRDVMHHLKELVRDGEVGDDEERRAEERVQKLTDEHVHRIDELLKRKEAEITEV